MNDAKTETALQIRKIGDSIGLIFPDELISRLNLKEGDTLHPVVQPDGTLQLTRGKTKRERTKEIARKMIHDYRDTFAALAK